MASSSEECSLDKPLCSLVSGQDSTMCDIVWVSPQEIHFFLQAPQWLCPAQKQFRKDHCCRGRAKPGCRIVGSSTRWKRGQLPGFSPLTVDVNWFQLTPQRLKKVSLQLFSKLSWVCHGTQVCRQSIPCRRSCVRERTFHELCAQMRQRVVSQRCWTETWACTASTSGLDDVGQIRWTRPVWNRVQNATQFELDAPTHWKPVQL